MALSLVITDDPQPLAPHREALRANLAAIRTARRQVDAIAVKDRAAAHTIANVEQMEQLVATLKETLIAAQSEAIFNNDPPPDLSHIERQIADAEQSHRNQQAASRVATALRSRCAAEMSALHHIISTRATEQPQLLWNAAFETLTERAAAFLEAERQMLTAYAAAFSAALTCDGLRAEWLQKGVNVGPMVGSGGVAYLQIPRPMYDGGVAIAAYDDGIVSQAPEAAHRARNERLVAMQRAADALYLELMAD